MLLLLCSSAFAQEPSYRHFDTGTGLPSATAYTVVQDRDGFIWISTDVGVSRFDGYGFTNFTTDDGLGGNETFAIDEDADGRLWCSAFNGQPSYYHEGAWHNAQTDPILDSVVLGQAAMAFLNPWEGGYWFGGFKGDLHYVSLTDGTTLKRLGQGVTAGSVHHIYPIDSNTVGVLHGYYYFVVSLVNGQLEVEEYPLREEHFSIHPGTMPNGDPVFFQGTRGYRIDQTTYQQVELPPVPGLNSSVIFLGDDAAGNVWIGTRNGALCLVGGWESGTVRRYLPGKAVTCVLQDHEGNYWFTTEGQGAFYTNSLNVVSYTHELNMPDNNVARVAVSEAGALFAGGFANSFAVRGPGAGTFQSHQLEGVAEASRGRVNSIVAGPNGSIWIAQDDLLTEWRDNKVAANYWPGGRDIVFERNNTKYISFASLLFKASEEVLDSIRTTAPIGRVAITRLLYRNTLLNERVLAMAQGADGTLLLSKFDGLYQFQFASSTVKRILSDVPALNRTVTDIEYDARGRWWFTTKGGGVVVWDGTEITTVTVENGLSTNFLSRVYVDADGVGWVCSKSGLNRVELAPDGSVRVATFEQGAGLASSEVNDVVHLRDTLWVATAAGLSAFPIAAFAPLDTLLPPTYIESVSAGATTHRPDSAVVINYNDMPVRIGFVGLAYNKHRQLEYRYALVGADSSGWNITSNQVVEFLSLPPGTYQFQVQARAGGGAWSKAAVVQKIVVQPAYWQTWWFKVGIMLLFFFGVVASAWSYNRRVIKSERAAEQVRRAIAEMELRALRAQMNPHFIANALNSIQRFILRNSQDEAYDYLQKFGTLIRKTLENSKHQAISIKEELETLELYLELEALRFDDKFTYTIDSQLSTADAAQAIPPMLIQPYVENAIWHGIMPRSSGGSVRITIDRVANSVRCRIQDDGIGRAASQELRSKHKRTGSSTGMKNTFERLKILSNEKQAPLRYQVVDLSDSDGVPTGTLVELHIPL